MTHDHYLQLLSMAKAQIAKRVQGLQPRGGNNVSVVGDGIAIDPIVRELEAPDKPTLMMNIWVKITMTQSMTEVITPPPPEYVENGVFEYPPFLVAAVSFSSAENGYEWEPNNYQEILPEAGSVSTPPGEFIPGSLWSGEYLEGTGPDYDVNIGDLQKTASIELYLRGRYLYSSPIPYGDPSFFDTDFNIGSREINMLLEGNRPSPFPNETEVIDERASYSGTTFEVEPLPRGAYPDVAVRSVLSITGIAAP